MATCDRNALTERTARRVVTMVPAFIVVGLGVDSMQALVISQVVLSFVLPVPMLALVYFTSRRDVMGEFASTRTTRRAAIGATVVIGALNVVLLVQSIGAMVPHPSGN
ncbi:divalent metal cation transporter [Burkholderia anthina]|uniref:divalent metal cation transporter n=1 Tax=Burkholderia anthina TaxID=179879 RepID=UPI001FC8D49E